MKVLANRVISSEDLPTIMLGTLVVNSEDKIEFVLALTCDRATNRIRRGQGQIFSGTINGKPMEKYRGLVVTLDLLAALGWTIDDTSPRMTVVTPDPYQFKPPVDEMLKDLVVRFLHADVEGFSAGEVLINNGKDWMQLDDFFVLELQFLEVHGQRMTIKFVDDLAPVVNG